MKKLCIVLLVCIPVYVSALPLSGGGGDVIGVEFQSYSWDSIELSGAFIDTGYYGFFDFYYGEIALNLLSAFGTVNYITGAKFSACMDLMTKYPFKINQYYILYPHVGVNAGYDFAIGLNMRILLGLGLDRFFNNNLFLRTEVFYSGVVLSQLFIEDKEFAAQNDFSYSSSNHGFVTKVGLGYRFK